jgi:hypothetical protein
MFPRRDIRRYMQRITRMAFVVIIRIDMRSAFWITAYILFCAVKVLVLGFVGPLLLLGFVVGRFIGIEMDAAWPFGSLIGGGIGLAVGIAVGIYRADFSIDWR